MLCFCFFFFNDTATTEIYTLSLHDALPISFDREVAKDIAAGAVEELGNGSEDFALGDRKSTRLNSSHVSISYAVFCLKKKKKNNYIKLVSMQNVSISLFSSIERTMTCIFDV